MNLQLNKAEEYIDGEMAGYLGEVLIRCNNILYIRAAENQDEPGDDSADDGGGAGGGGMEEWFDGRQAYGC